ncbi:hypothetical protein OIU78_006802 [Salix suchowensis]|nr:hypothetical protein OIU78_006802 [Salix suchowensis]
MSKKSSQHPRQFINSEIITFTILTYGSHGLGVHDPESDIDALCVGPFFATIALKALYVPENVDVLSLSLLNNIDETSWKSLSGVRANQRILLLVPNLKNFQSMLRCLKLWAKRRGVYGRLNGFLGGVHLAILAAFVCQNQPDASVIALISNFFSTYAMWPWPTPVILQDGMPSNVEDVIETRLYMPIRLPCTPYEYCDSNVTKSTFNKIRVEFLRGHAMTRDLLKIKLDFDVWRIFEPFPISTNYTRFCQNPPFSS